MTSSTVVGGAMLPHAPQFFTLPPTEDMQVVQAVRDVAAKIGEGLHALDPDLWIIISNDHAEQFFHQVSPAFTVHVGGEVSGHFAGHDFHWTVPGEIGLKLVRSLYQQGFDPAFTSTAKADYAMGIPLTHIGLKAPVLPIFVNAYLPPQPSMERCYAFGQAVARAVTLMGLRTVVIASGGMSHFPGTANYANPALEWDKKVVAQLAEGRLKSLLGYDAPELDETGNIELRCWALAAGAMGGEHRPDVVSLNPSWHHNYASLGWFNLQGREPEPHYPSTKPELVQLVSALHAIAHEEADRQAWLSNPTEFADRFKLTPDQRKALIAMDVPSIVAMGTHPLVPFLANMQIERIRREAKVTS
jgi:2,3-dihydroxyphenylpropionate 1,2-dioxygenase